MSFRRREKPLHERLAEQGGMTMSTEVTRDVAPWNQAGVHGVPRPRQWDAVVTAEADLPGDSVHFVTLEDRTVVVDEDVPDDQLAPLADAVETQLNPPYRAEGTRRDDRLWAVGASKISVVAIDEEIGGDTVELAVREGVVTQLVDGAHGFGSMPGARGAGCRNAVVRRARRPHRREPLGGRRPAALEADVKCRDSGREAAAFRGLRASRIRASGFAACAASSREPLPLARMAQSMGSFEKVLRLGEGRRLKRLAEQAAYVGTLEPEFEALSDEQLAGKTAEFKERLEKGESLEELLFEAFAAVREAFKRTIGVRLFDVQLMGGITLHEGDIAEMKTGEGKTFVAVQPLYLNALEGRACTS